LVSKWSKSDHWKSESLEQAKLLAMSADREEKLRAKEAKR
jgi:hypothetical protein